MEDEPADEGEGSGYPPVGRSDHVGSGVSGPGSDAPVDAEVGGGTDAGTDARPEVRALAEEADEIRRLVDAGAGSPEALRDLAARLREHRAREEALWRTEVKPALVKENKGRLRGHRTTPAPPRPERPSSNLGALGLLLLLLVLAVVIAANTSVWVLVVPVLALVAWAWREGRDSSS